MLNAALDELDVIAQENGDDEALKLAILKRAGALLAYAERHPTTSAAWREAFEEGQREATELLTEGGEAGEVFA